MVEELANRMVGSRVQRSGKTRRIDTRDRVEVIVEAVSAGSALNTPVKTPAKVVDAPKDAVKVQYGDRNIAIHRVRKTFDGEPADYLQFSGFRGRFGDWTITMKQARLLADPAVQEALSEYMEQVPE